MGGTLPTLMRHSSTSPSRSRTATRRSATSTTGRGGRTRRCARGGTCTTSATRPESAASGRRYGDVRHTVPVSDIAVTEYVLTADGAHLAYQVIGEGGLTLVVLPGVTIPIDLMWEDPNLIRIGRRLS